jgi:hypothetical protein
MASIKLWSWSTKIWNQCIELRRKGILEALKCGVREVKYKGT